MKIKTKLIAIIMSICLVCAVFAIGVFALKTANLKIGGDVSFSATGVEADIKNATLSNTVADDGDGIVLATGSINTSMTQTNIDSTFQNWQTLELDFDENATDIELKFDIANTSTNANNYIEIDYSYSFSNANPNVDVFSGDENDQKVWENNNYILAPKGSAANATYKTFTLKFKVLNKELNVPQDTKVSVNIALKHTTPSVGTLNGTKLTTPDGLVYDITENSATLGNNVSYTNKNVNISPIVADAQGNNYIVTGIGANAFSGNSTIEKITIPNSVVSIGNNAFEQSSLVSVVIPSSVSHIGSCAFSECASLSSVTFVNQLGWKSNTQSLDLSNPEQNVTLLKQTYCDYEWAWKELPPPQNPTEHVHSFAPLAGNQAIDFCAGCNGYLVKGVGSEYLGSGEQAQTLDQILTDENVQPVDGKMNFIISGSVDYDAQFQGAGGSIDLAKGDATEVSIVGCGQNPELTLVTGDTQTADNAVFRTKFIEAGTVASGKISVVGLKLNDTRKTSTTHYTLTNTEFQCGELYIEDCTFTNCVQFSRGTKATIKNCVFDFNIKSRYSIWAGYVGGDDGVGMDFVESFVIEGCTFNNTTRGIKVVTSGADIKIESNTFIGITEKPAIMLDSKNVEINTVLLKNNTFTNCAKGDWNSKTNLNYDEPYSEECFNVTIN